jgi:hypothetical protein
MDARPRASCRAFFKTKMNFEVHSFNTRKNTNIFQPSTHLKICQKGPYHSGIKVFHSLPLENRNSFCNDQRFKVVLNKFLLTQSFYTLDEYFDHIPCNIIT